MHCMRSALYHVRLCVRLCARRFAVVYGYRSTLAPVRRGDSNDYGGTLVVSLNVIMYTNARDHICFIDYKLTPRG